MTDPSPLPPPGRQLGVSTVMAGEILTDLDSGAQTVAMEDAVLLVAFTDGTQDGSWPLTPSQAMSLAKGLSSACGTLINREVDDTGAPLTWWDRLTRLRDL